MTTPEHYPLSLNSLVLACNQKTNREPVTNYHQREVDEALQQLRDKGLVHSGRAEGERAVKHRHTLREAFRLSERAWALLAVLLLRGPQTPGELRARSERYLRFAEVAEVEAALAELAEHTPPLAVNLGRGPGQNQDRWAQLLSGPEPRPRARPKADSELEALRAEVAELRALLERLYRHLGLTAEP